MNLEYFYWLALLVCWGALLIFGDLLVRGARALARRRPRHSREFRNLTRNTRGRAAQRRMFEGRTNAR